MMINTLRLLRVLGVAAIAVAAVTMALNRGVRAAERAVRLPAPQSDDRKQAGPMQTAVLAGGCFWGVQGVFEHVRGVRRVLSGYAGGDRASASYETVSSGATGHAESVQIEFDPQEVTYGEILQVYFSVAHDPTQLNRQGPDVGTQYRSAIFYANETQKALAARYIAQLNAAKVFERPIVTRLDPLKGFYPAEGYHQDFLVNHPDHPYIVFNDLPKIDHLQQMFPGLYRPAPATVSAGR